jgi:peptidoglycan/LPS O-acetylase OafA/YrhL
VQIRKDMVKINFRYDVGFLRAIAVLVVILFHYQIPFFQGGFVGVDVFFVISGFLMTSIILKGFLYDSFSLKEFYNRRFLRIVPALIGMMLCILLLTYFIYFPIDFKQVSLYSFYSSLFLSNYYYLFNSGYFDPSSQFNILLHTWSLSVEWQFYIIYPLFLLLIKNIYTNQRKKFNTIFFVLTLFSFFLMIVFNNFLPSSFSKISFFSFTHRAWEMMVGGMAFLYKDFFDNKMSNVLKRILNLIALILIGFSVVCFNEKDVWPSSFTLIPVVCSFLIIATHHEFRFYKNSIVQYIGNISYSWYLWHWPIIVISKYFDFKGAGVTFFLIVTSFILSSLSYEFIEKRSKNIKTKILIKATFIVIFASVVGSFFSINEKIFFKEAIDVTEFKSNYEQTRKKQFNSGVCHNVAKIKYKQCLCLNPKKKNILLLGDSHAGQFSLSFRTKLDSTKFNFMEHTVVGSFPLINSKGEQNSTKQFKSLMDKFIPENKNSISLILLSCNWMNYPTSGGYKSNKELGEGITATIKMFEKLGIKVIVIGQGEEYDIEFPRVVAFNLQGNRQKNYVNLESAELNNDLKRIIPSKNYFDIFLNSEIQHYDSKNNIPYMFDDDHMTLYGADQVVDLFLKKKIF